MALTVECYDAGGKSPVATKATRVLIKDDSGNPICLAVSFGEEQTFVAHIDDEEFAGLLKTFGLEAAVVLKKINLRRGD